MRNKNGLGPIGETMNLERFKQIVESYGADPSRWPEDERAAAQSFAEQEPRARIVLERERFLDMALGSIDEIKPSSQLTEAILADAAQVSQGVTSGLGGAQSLPSQSGWLTRLKGVLGDIDSIDWSLKGWVQPGAVLACAALAGLITGVLVPVGGTSDMLYSFEDADVLSVAFGQTDYELDSWTMNGGGQ